MSEVSRKCPSCSNSLWSKPDHRGVRSCTACSFKMWFAEDSFELAKSKHASVTADDNRKNTTNKYCVFCGKETVPLFHQDRYCPKCEGSQTKQPEKKKQLDLDFEEITTEIDINAIDWSGTFKCEIINAEYNDSSCEVCGDLSCHGMCMVND